MSKFDYKLFHALDAVISLQSFDRAAQQLHMTQSAVSQRIKQLETLVAQPVLIRSQPLQLTELGQQLLQHYRQVQQLERELLPQIYPEESDQLIRIALATNADSLATWLLPALQPLLSEGHVEMNFLIEDESRTIERLRKGEAFGAITLQAEPLPGCQSDYLGTVDYILIAAPAFIRRFFPQGLTIDALRKAPGVSFDPRDDMHVTFIQKYFGLPSGSYPCHIVRSSETFVTMAKLGLAYCIIPSLQITSELNSGELVNLLPETPLKERLYWQRWVLEKGIYRQISQHIRETAHRLLIQENS